VPPEQGDSWRDAKTRTGGERHEAASSVVLGLTILAHSDARRIGERVALLALASGREERLSRLEPDFAAPGAPLRRPLADPYLSRRPLCFLPAAAGAVRLACRDSPSPIVADGEPVHGERAFTEPEIERGVVLLRGETGTGKELVALAIHQASARRDRPYLAVNMGAIPSSLAASELFGAAKGAFTGADQKKRGYFSRAAGGTLFLDEIGEIPPDVQPLLLRALESGEIQPVGAEQIQRVDVRTIAATDSDLEAEIASGRFRAPLLHRLSGYEIRVPALRRRRDDIGRLLLHFLRLELEAVGEARLLEEAAGANRPWLHASVVARLAQYDWPGNVRQLRNAARSIAVESRGAAGLRLGAQIERLLTPLPRETDETRRPAADPVLPAVRRRSPQEISDPELVAALRANRWEPRRTAEHLGISRAALYLLIDACPLTRKAADLESPEIQQALCRSDGSFARAACQLEVSEEGLKRRMKKLGLRPASSQPLR
jgi:two-component system nitrogen regulation response regulator GlnG